MTSITWAGPSCVQELAAILAPQNRTQGRCDECAVLSLPSIAFIRVKNLTFMFITKYDKLIDGIYPNVQKPEENFSEIHEVFIS